MTLPLNTSYLNRTPNKTARSSAVTPFSPIAAVCHETAGYGSLDWNLKPDVKSSYNYLISRGRIYHYVDEQLYISWGAGVNSTWVIGAQRYNGAAINSYFVNIELEGPNDGSPMYRPNLDALVELMIYLSQRYNIPLIPSFWPEHWEVCQAIKPGYKSDARGYSASAQVTLAAQQSAPSNAELANRNVLGVAPSISLPQYQGMISDHGGLKLATLEEWQRIYLHCSSDQVDPAFLMAVAKHESGSPLGMSPLAQRTRQLWNIKAAPGEWRPTVAHNGSLWHADESVYQGARRAIHHFKQYGWERKDQPATRNVADFITRYAPASDNNNVKAYITSVLTDMAYMRQRPG